MKFAAPAAIGAALVKVGKFGVDAFNEVEGGLNELITRTGATGEAAEALESVYKNVATSVVGDFDDIGAAVGELNTRLGLNGEELESASEAAMKYAKVNGQDAADAVADVTRMMNNAGISADEYGDVLDKLTVASQQSGIDVSTLASSVNQNAASFKELGLSADEAIAMLSQFEKSGADTSGILAGMKKGVQNWTKEGKSAKDGFAEFVKGVEDGSLTSADAIELFGAKAGITMFDAAKKGQLSFEDMYAAIEDSSGALDSVYDSTLTVSEKMDLAWQNVKVAVSDAMGPLMEIAADVLTNTVIPAIQTTSETISEFLANAKTFYDTNIQPIVEDVMSVIMPIMESVKTAIVDGMETARGIFEEVLPIIQNLVADVWPDIQNIIQNVMEILQTVVPPIWNRIQKNIQTVMKVCGAIVKAVWPVMANIVRVAITAIKNAVNGVRVIVTRVRSIFNSVKKTISEKITSAKDKVKEIIDKIKGFFPFSIGKIMDNIKLPHFKLEGSFSLNPPSVPTLSIDWYAKAMSVPYLFDKPTLFGAGEAGPEVMYGKNALMTDIKNAVSSVSFDMADSIVSGINTLSAASAGGGDIYVTLYAYPGGPQMDKAIVKSYDRGKKKGLR